MPSWDGKVAVLSCTSSGFFFSCRYLPPTFVAFKSSFSFLLISLWRREYSTFLILSLFCSPVAAPSLLRRPSNSFAEAGNVLLFPPAKEVSHRSTGSLFSILRYRPVGCLNLSQQLLINLHGPFAPTRYTQYPFFNNSNHMYS